MTLFGDFVTGQNNVTYKRMRQILEDMALQEGVLGSGDFKVTQDTGSNMQIKSAAGQAYIAVDTGSLNGLSHAYSDAIETRSVSSSNGTNPRIDQVILRYNDTAIGTGSGNSPTIEVLTGTATAGAQAATPGAAGYRAGAAALPADAIRLADVLVPAASAAVTTANIVDRRPWARGAFVRLSRTSGNVAAPVAASSGATAIDSAGLLPRIECSGVPLRLSLVTHAIHTVAGNTVGYRYGIDGTFGTDDRRLVTVPTASGQILVVASWTIPSPTPGSHLIGPYHYGPAATGTTVADTSFALEFVVEEICRQNVANT